MKTISLAIIEVMKDVAWVAKNMTVWSWNNSYKWVSDKDVRLIMRESMIKNWLSILPISISPKIQIDRWDEMDTYKKEMRTKQSCFTEVETRYILLHTSGESIEVCWYGQWVDSQDKWAGKATTYALKNTLLNMFLVPTWVDTDDTHSEDIETPQVKQKNKLNTYGKRELGEIIEEMREEQDINRVKVLYSEALDLKLTDKQKTWLETEKEDAKVRLITK